MTGHQFCGEWKSSSGDDVRVFFDVLRHGQLTAVLTRKFGRELCLGIREIQAGWMCGSFVLLGASPCKDQLHWRPRRGSVSVWYRCAAIPLFREAMDSEPLCQCAPIHLPREAMVSEPLAQADESLEDQLSGCQSPIEAYFNPPAGSLCTPGFSFFPSDCFAQTPWFSDSTGVHADDASPLPAEERISHVESVIGNVWKLSQTATGCRKVQAEFENGLNCARVAIASELRGHVWKSVESPHANFVLALCIEKLTPDASQFIVDELKSWKGAPAYLARHKFGCRIFERLLEHCPMQVKGMIDELLINESIARTLCMDSFGNYMMQHIFEHGYEDQKRALAELLSTCASNLCDNENAIAVIAKALECAPFQERQVLARVLLRDERQFVKLALRRFGNVAVQAILKMSGQEGRTLQQFVRDHEKQLKTCRHGRAVLKIVPAAATVCP